MITVFSISPLRDLERDFAGEIADRAFELAYAGFARVSCRQQIDRVVGDLELVFLQAVFFDLARDQILLGDVAVFPVAVTGELDDLHAVAQRHRDRSELIRRRDKENLRQIERQIEIVIAERVVLLPGRESRAEPTPDRRENRCPVLSISSSIITGLLTPTRRSA